MLRGCVYEENIISIADIVPDQKVSIIGRLIRVPTPHSYESNGKKGKVTSLEIQDSTGKISYTLWNNDVHLSNTHPGLTELAISIAAI